MGCSSQWGGSSRKISQRHRIPIPLRARHLFCRSCFSAYRYGENVRVRILAGQRTMTCMKCSSIRRYGGGPKSHRKAETQHSYICSFATVTYLNKRAFGGMSIMGSDIPESFRREANSRDFQVTDCAFSPGWGTVFRGFRGFGQQETQPAHPPYSVVLIRKF